MRRINKIIIHCTATKAGVPFTVETIRRCHVRERGWSDIGYHYVVYLDGTVHAGRALSRPGAHTRGHNAHSIGVCYVGGLDASGKPCDTRTAQQRNALLALVKELKRRFPGATVHGHREFANKACPCFDAKREYAAV